MQSTKLIIVKVSAILFLLIGCIGWFIPACFSSLPSYIELPLGQADGIETDRAGNIYCGSRFYGRIQAYDPEGKFIRGFNTKVGPGRKDLFIFSINEDKQLCITIIRARLTNTGAMDRSIIYDLDGNLISTVEYPSRKRASDYPGKNETRDLFGSHYTLKGSLFPRVIKHTRAGDKSVIIRTPIWLWFFQGPFPAFAFSFVSMFVLIFLEFRHTAKKMSISVLDFAINRNRLPKYKKLILIGIGIFGLAVALCFLFPFGLDKKPILVIFGLISFTITMVLVMLTLLVYTLRVQWHMARKHFDLWKKSLFSSSLQVRYEAGRQLQALKDPVERKWSIVCNRIGMSIFFIWLITFTLVTIAVIILGLIGKI